MSGLITLLTDFGNKDGFVGTMKGVILVINPNVKIIDVSHEISQGDINSAGFILAQSAPYFPANTIHVAVVDPGVGSTRKALLVETPNAFFIAPDNGLLKFIFAKEKNCKVFEITNTAYFLDNVSNTFHGRDIFAPVAAFLSKGISPEKIGPVTNEFERGKISLPAEKGNNVFGEIIYIDHFGNLITNIPAKMLKSVNEIRIGNKTLPGIFTTYSSVKESELVSVIGSHGLVEIAKRNGNAHMELNAELATKVIIESNDI